MPIRPENRARYPQDWPAISHRIRERARWCCEECGVTGYALGGRTPDGKWHEALPTGDNGLKLTWPRPGETAACQGGHQLRIVRIILTVAHLDHQPENCTDDNLKALCQRCHLRYDAAEKRKGMAERARLARAAKDLFQEPPTP